MEKGFQYVSTQLIIFLAYSSDLKNKNLILHIWYHKWLNQYIGQCINKSANQNLKSKHIKTDIKIADYSASIVHNTGRS